MTLFSLFSFNLIFLVSDSCPLLLDTYSVTSFFANSPQFMSNSSQNVSPSFVNSRSHLQIFRLPVNWCSISWILLLFSLSLPPWCSSSIWLLFQFHPSFLNRSYIFWFRAVWIRNRSKSTFIHPPRQAELLDMRDTRNKGSKQDRTQWRLINTINQQRVREETVGKWWKKLGSCCLLCTRCKKFYQHLACYLTGSSK